MMSVLSIVLMTLLTLSITEVHAEKFDMPNKSEQISAQQELVDIFFAAAKTGNNKVIREFLKYGFPVDVKNTKGFTPLMMASYYGQKDVVNILLQNGANRCERDNKGNTALMGAIFKLEWGIAKQLREVDCDVAAKQKGQKTTAEFARVIGQADKLEALENED